VLGDGRRRGADDRIESTMSMAKAYATITTDVPSPDTTTATLSMQSRSSMLLRPENGRQARILLLIGISKDVSRTDTSSGLGFVREH
jgi:hypothetical protein